MQYSSLHTFTSSPAVQGDGITFYIILHQYQSVRKTQSLWGGLRKLQNVEFNDV